MPVKIPHFARDDRLRAKAYDSYCEGSIITDTTINEWLRDIVGHLEEFGPEYEGFYMTASGDTYIIGFWGNAYDDGNFMIEVVIATGNGYYKLLLPKTRKRRIKIRDIRGDINPHEI